MEEDKDQLSQLVNRTTMEALVKLRRFIDREYADGGWLPSGRVMSSRLNISRMTYVKSLSRLVAEGLAVNYPKKGTRIKPLMMRKPKAGIILDRGESSPFLGALEIFSPFLKKLSEEEKTLLQIIQASPPENLLRTALFHCVNSLAWISPPSNLFGVVKEIHDSEIMPVLLVRYFDPKSPEDIATGDIPVVSLDYPLIGKSRADFLLKLGHRRIAFVGDPWFAEFIRFGSGLRAAGAKFTRENCFSSSREIEERFPDFITSRKITAVFSEGDLQDTLFPVLNRIPTEKQPELFLRYGSQIDLYRKIHPNVKNVWLEKIDMDVLGATAAGLLTANLIHGKPFESVSVPPGYRMERAADLT